MQAKAKKERKKKGSKIRLSSFPLNHPVSPPGLRRISVQTILQKEKKDLRTNRFRLSDRPRPPLEEEDEGLEVVQDCNYLQLAEEQLHFECGKKGERLRNTPELKGGE